jgi:hypothetical protein
MALSEQRARELAELEPPPSIDRIVRFFEDLSLRLSGINPGTSATAEAPAGIGGNGLRAAAFADRMAAQSEQFGANEGISTWLQSLMARYQLDTAEVRDFAVWLMLWNDKRSEMEVIRDPNVYGEPGQAAPGDTSDRVALPVVRRRVAMTAAAGAMTLAPGAVAAAGPTQAADGALWSDSMPSPGRRVIRRERRVPRATAAEYTAAGNTEPIGDRPKVGRQVHTDGRGDYTEPTGDTSESRAYGRDGVDDAAAPRARRLAARRKQDALSRAWKAGREPESVVADSTEMTPAEARALETQALADRMRLGLNAVNRRVWTANLGLGSLMAGVLIGRGQMPMLSFPGAPQAPGLSPQIGTPFGAPSFPTLTAPAFGYNYSQPPLPTASLHGVAPPAPVPVAIRPLTAWQPSQAASPTPELPVTQPLPPWQPPFDSTLPSASQSDAPAPVQPDVPPNPFIDTDGFTYPPLGSAGLSGPDLGRGASSALTGAPTRSVLGSTSNQPLSSLTPSRSIGLAAAGGLLAGQSAAAFAQLLAAAVSGPTLAPTTPLQSSAPAAASAVTRGVQPQAGIGSAPSSPTTSSRALSNVQPQAGSGFAAFTGGMPVSTGSLPTGLPASTSRGLPGAAGQFAFAGASPGFVAGAGSDAPGSGIQSRSFAAAPMAAVARTVSAPSTGSTPIAPTPGGVAPPIGTTSVPITRAVSAPSAGGIPTPLTRAVSAPSIGAIATLARVGATPSTGGTSAPLTRTVSALSTGSTPIAPTPGGVAPPIGTTSVPITRAVSAPSAGGALAMLTRGGFVGAAATPQTDLGVGQVAGTGQTAGTRRAVNIGGRPQNPVGDTGRPPTITPQMGQITLVAPPLQVASAQAERSGAAMAFDWSTLAGGAGVLDEGGLTRLKAALPAGAAAIYPALPPGAGGPNAVNLSLAPSLTSAILERSYGSGAVGIAGRAASMSAPLAGGKTAAPLGGRLIPAQRPAGAQPDLLGAPLGNGAGALAQAGQGAASRGSSLDFLGMPIRLAPSLGGRSELKDETAVRSGAGAAAATVRPELFAPLRDRLFPRFSSVTAEPDQAAWSKAAPAFGMRDGKPTTLLAPDARVPIPTATSPLPQMNSGAIAAPGSPGLPAALAGPLSTAIRHQARAGIPESGSVRPSLPLSHPGLSLPGLVPPTISPSSIGSAVSGHGGLLSAGIGGSIPYMGSGPSGTPSIGAVGSTPFSLPTTGAASGATTVHPSLSAYGDHYGDLIATGRWRDHVAMPQNEGATRGSVAIGHRSPYLGRAFHEPPITRRTSSLPTMTSTVRNYGIPTSTMPVMPYTALHHGSSVSTDRLSSAPSMGGSPTYQSVSTPSTVPHTAMPTQHLLNGTAHISTHAPMRAMMAPLPLPDLRGSAPNAYRPSSAGTRRSPDMLLPAYGRAETMRTSHAPVTIQRSARSGGATASGGHESEKRSQMHGGADHRDSANEVNLLANEVWAVLKRRFMADAERHGRW